MRRRAATILAVIGAGLLTGCPESAPKAAGVAVASPSAALDPRFVVERVRGVGELRDADTHRPVVDAEVTVRLRGAVIATHRVTDRKGRMSFETKLPEAIYLDPVKEPEGLVFEIRHPEYETRVVRVARADGAVLPVLGNQALDPIAKPEPAADGTGR